MNANTSPPLTIRDVDAAIAADDGIRSALLAPSINSSPAAMLRGTVRAAFLAGAMWALHDLRAEAVAQQAITEASKQ